MFCGRMAQQLKLQRVRQFHSTFIKNENKSVNETAQTPKSQVNRRTENVIGSPMHNVSNFDKKILVWVKRFPSADQVPAQVSIECIQKAHTMFRVRIAFAIFGLSIVGFITSAMIGKRDVASGKNLYTERMKWHKEVERKAAREAENANA